MISKSRIETIKPEIEIKILKYLSQGKEYTFSQDEELAEWLGVKAGRGMTDWLKFLLDQGKLIVEKSGRQYHYKLNDKKKVLEELRSHKDTTELAQALQMLAEGESDRFMEDFQRVFSTKDSVVGGHLAIIESLEDENLREKFDLLKKSIKDRKYLYVTTTPMGERFENVKPIQLFFLDNNWYVFIAYKNANEDENAKFLRLSFIKSIEVMAGRPYSNKNTFQKKELQQYEDFLDTVQNAMTLYGVKTYRATLKALPFIAKYFEVNMKKFFPSQEFLRKEEDGSIVFTIEYTQPLEILPFVQKWIPDLVIVSPEELQKAYSDKLQTALSRQGAEVNSKI